MEDVCIAVPYFVVSDTRVDIMVNGALMCTYGAANVAIENLISTRGLVDMWKVIYASDYIEKVNTIREMEKLIVDVRGTSVEYEIEYIVRDILGRIINGRLPVMVAEALATSDLAFNLSHRDIKKLPRYVIVENSNRFNVRELDKCAV